VLATLGLLAGVLLPFAPAAPAPTAEAATFPSGLQTGFQLNGQKSRNTGTPPTQFDWDDFLQPPPTQGQTPVFVPTAPYTTLQGLSSTGIFQGTFSWDDSSFNNCAANADPTVGVGGTTINTNPWVTRAQNASGAADLCSAGYAVEALSDGVGLRHFMLYGYFTRANGGTASFATSVVFEGPLPGRCDDIMLDVLWPDGNAVLREWVPTSGNCNAVDGPGQWRESNRTIDFTHAAGVRTEGPNLNTDPNTFFEYGIDLTNAGLFGDSVCSTYTIGTTFFRSSQSTTSNLGDFFTAQDPMSVANCGTLSVSKQVTPPGTTDDAFGFTVTNDTSQGVVIPPDQTSIVDTVHNGETKTYEGVISSQSLHLSETGLPENWQLERAVCTYVDRTGVTRQVDVTDPSTPFSLQGGGRTDCVLTNTAALLTVTKQTLPDGSDARFGFSVNGASQGELGDGESFTIAVPAGPVQIGETAVDGWIPPDWSCTNGQSAQGTAAFEVTAVVGDNITCTVTNTQFAAFTIEKRVPLSLAGTTFSFQSEELGDFQLTPVDTGIPGFATATRTFTGLYPGEVSVAEVPMDGFDLISLSCFDPPYGFDADLDGNTAQITLRPGSNASCSFTNTLTPPPDRANLTITKETRPVTEWDQDFGMQVDGPEFAESGPESITLNTIGDDWSWSQEVLAGEYVISEDQLPGWSIGSAVCTRQNGQPVDFELVGSTLTVDVVSEANVTCSFVNLMEPAQARITKTVAGIGAGQAWRFDVALSPAPGDARQLTGQGPGTAATTWGELLPGQRYVIRETPQAAWSMGPITCTGVTDLDDDPLSFTFDAQIGQQLECGMTNTAQPSSFSLRKISSGLSADYAWSYHVQMKRVSTGETSERTLSGVGTSAVTETWGELIPGEVYELSETDLPDQVQQLLTGCTGGTAEQIPDGIRFTAPLASDSTPTVLCNLQNNVEPVSATITKTTTSGDGAFPFDLTAVGVADPPTTVAINTTGGVGTGSFELVPGRTYTLTERDQAGWLEGDPSCTVTPSDGRAPYTIDLRNAFSVLVGDAITCDVENSPAPATVTFTKTVEGLAVSTPWAFPVTLTPGGGDGVVKAVSGTGTGAANAASVSWTDVEAGTYTLAEGGLTGWDAGEVTCSGTTIPAGQAGAITFTVPQGGSVVCVATNTAQAADINVIKNTAGIGPDVPWSFDFVLSPAPDGQQNPVTLTGTGPGPAGPMGWTSLTPGALYTIEETAESGWTSALECRTATGVALTDVSLLASFQFVAQPGVSYICEAANAAIPGSGTITKTTIGGDGTFPFVLDTVPSSSPTTVNVATSGNTGSAPLPTLTPGLRYSLTEPPVDGWTPTVPLACTRTPITGGPPVPVADLDDFTVAVGDVFACTATNQQLGKVILYKEVHGTGDQVRGFDFTSNVPGHASFSVDGVQDNGELVPYEIDDVVPGEGFFFTEQPDTVDPVTDLADLACTYGGDDHTGDLDTRTATFSVLPGETTECYFTNAVPGTIVLIKRSVPPNYTQDFAFTIQGPSIAAEDEAFTINSNPAIDGAIRSWSDLDPGEYTITEGAMPTGWHFNPAPSTFCNTAEVDWAVDEAEQSLTIDLPLGGVITCYVSNRADTASVSATKSVSGVDPSLSWSFPLSISPAGGITDPTKTVSSTGSPTATWTDLTPGVTYTLSEPTGTGYTTQGYTCRDDATGAVVADLTPETPNFTFVAQPALQLSCDLVNAAVPASVSIVKTVTGVASPLEWSFDFSLTWSGGSEDTQQLSGTGNTTSGPATWNGLVPGRQYTLTEAPLPGWAQGAIFCNGVLGQTGSFTFTAQPGQTLTCTIANAGRASGLTVQKQVTGVAADLPWIFPLSISPAVGVSGAPQQNLTGVGTVAAAAASWASLVPGTRYTIGETLPAGWTLDDVVCVGAEVELVLNSFSFVAPLNGQVACTITNLAAQASLTFEKTVAGVADDYDWSFPVTLAPEAGGGGTQSAEGTGDGAAPPLEWTDLVPGQVYTLAEEIGDDWTTAGITCQGVVDLDPGPAVRFVAGIDQSISCAATNTAVQATLSFVKTVAGVADGYEWSFPVTLDPAAGDVATQDAVGTGNTSAEPLSWSDLVPGAEYELTEVADGFTAGEFECSIQSELIDSGAVFTPGPGDEISCAVTNTAIAPTVSLTKTVTGVADDYDWSVDVTIDPAADPSATQTVSGTGPGTSDPAEWTDLVPGGTYTVTEDSTGWSPTGFTCDADGAVPVEGGVTFTAVPGAEIECAAENDAVPGGGTIEKTAVGADGSFDFVLTPVGDASQTITVTTEGGNGSAGLPGLTPGIVYSLEESATPGWRVSEALACTITPPAGEPVGIEDLTAFSVDPGDTVSCTATNEKLGRIVIVKAVDGDDATFDYTGSWLGEDPAFSITTSGGTGSAAFDDVPAGTYTVTELPTDGYENTALVCSGGESSAEGSTGTIDLQPGQTVTCTYSNTQWGVLVVDKSTAPAGATATFDFEWGPVDGESEQFSLTDAGEPFTTSPLEPGEYTVTELPHSAWDLSTLVCTGSSGEPVIDGAAASVLVAAGDTVLCSFTNTRVAQFSVTKTVSDEPVSLGGDQYRIGYRLVVTAIGDAGQSYDLDDRLQLGAGMTIISATVASLDGVPVEADWNGVDAVRVATNAPIAAGESHVFTVTVVASVPSSVTDEARLCVDGADPTAAGGHLNTASVGSDGVTDGTADACADALQPPTPGPLPPTGVDLVPPLVLAVLLAAGGLALFLFSRRRRRA